MKKLVPPPPSSPVLFLLTIPRRYLCCISLCVGGFICGVCHYLSLISPFCASGRLYFVIVAFSVCLYIFLLCKRHKGHIFTLHLKCVTHRKFNNVAWASAYLVLLSISRSCSVLAQRGKSDQTVCTFSHVIFCALAYVSKYVNAERERDRQTERHRES